MCQDLICERGCFIVNLLSSRKNRTINQFFEDPLKKTLYHTILQGVLEIIHMIQVPSIGSFQIHFIKKIRAIHNIIFL